LEGWAVASVAKEMLVLQKQDLWKGYGYSLPSTTIPETVPWAETDDSRAKALAAKATDEKVILKELKLCQRVCCLVE
jgi:hypothetical protein